MHLSKALDCSQNMWELRKSAGPGLIADDQKKSNVGSLRKVLNTCKAQDTDRST